MDRAYLESLKKDELIELILEKEEIEKIHECKEHELKKEIVKSKFEDYIYKDYVNTKELLENERNIHIRLNDRVKDLEDLLEKYKNIVDKMGGGNREW